MRVVCQWGELPALDNHPQLSHKVDALQLVQQGQHLRYVVILSHRIVRAKVQKLFVFRRSKKKKWEKAWNVTGNAHLCKSVIDFSRLPKQERWNQVEPRCAERWHLRE